MRDAPRRRSISPSPTTPEERPLQLKQAVLASARLLLRPAVPFRLDLTVWALRHRPTNEIDRWDGAIYSRVLVVGDQPFLVTLTQQGTVLEGTITGPRVSTSVQAWVSVRIFMNFTPVRHMIHA